MFFSWKKIIEFRFEFQWNLLPGVQFTVSQHWFKKWLGAAQGTCHYLNQWWLSSLALICSTMGRWVKSFWTKSITTLLLRKYMPDKVKTHSYEVGICNLHLIFVTCKHRWYTWQFAAASTTNVWYKERNHPRGCPELYHLYGKVSHLLSSDNLKLWELKLNISRCRNELK